MIEKIGWTIIIAELQKLMEEGGPSAPIPLGYIKLYIYIIYNCYYSGGPLIFTIAEKCSISITNILMYNNAILTKVNTF